MTLVGRSQIDHPALGTAGGSALHAAIETIYTNIGNALSGRYETASGVANSVVTTITHNFGVPFSDLQVLLYTGSFPNFVRVSDPAAAGWTIAATSGNLKTRINVTAPSSGGPHTFGVFIVQGRGNERLREMGDVDFTVAPTDGQLFVYDAASSKWKPSHLYYNSETASLASNIITPTTGTTTQRITSGTGDIQMIAGPSAGKVYVLVNETGADLTLKNDTGTTAANRFYTGTGVDMTLKNQSAVTVFYNSGLSRWIVSGGSGGGGLATSLRTSAFTAAPGNHYLCSTTAGAYTVTLPAGVTGAVIRFSDDTRNWSTNNLTLAPASGQSIDGLAANESLVCDLNGAFVQLMWDGSKWVVDTNGYAASVSSSGGGLVPTPISSSATVQAGKHYLVSTSAGALTITLPTGVSGNAIRFSDSDETWDTNNLTVAPASGETIDNLSAGESLVCDVKRGWVELSWTGSKWSLSSLASTQTAEASATQTGTVNTGAQTFAGAKTFNDVTAFKATGGTVSAGSYATTGSWTLGPAGGLGGSTAALILQGGNLLGGSNVGDAAIKIGSGTTYGGVIQLSDLGTTTFYIDSLYNSDSAKIQFRMKTAGSAVNVGDVVGSGVWTFGDGNLPAATSCVKIKKTNAVSNRLIEGIDAATRGYIRINSAQTNLEFEGASDRRIKTEIETIENALDKITSLNPVNYRLKTGVVTTQGFIAQEFKQVFPQSVTTTDDGLGDELPAGTEPWSMSDSCLIPYLVKAIKELVARIEQIEKTR